MFLKPNLVLIGFMGVGKSAVAHKLAGKLKYGLIATDEIIERQQAQSIAQIFAESGEPYFRDLERQVVRALSLEQGVVIDGGGGLVLQPENMTILKKNGLIFYLTASKEVIFERIKAQLHRPLLLGEDPLGRIEKLLKERSPLYERYADHTIDTEHKSVAQVTKEILKIYGAG